jgi:predicted metal-dependent HD superfamily phosphohydrolase
MAAGATLPGNVTRIITLLKGIREPAIRRRSLAAALADGDADDWAGALADLLAHRVATDDADASATVDTLVHAVAAPHLPYSVRQALYEAAHRMGHGAVARLFLDASPVNEAELLRKVGGERPIEPRGRALTLGVR